MPISLPTSLSYAGATGADSVTYTVTGHTTQEPFFVIFDRRTARYDKKTNSWSKPYTRCRIHKKFADSNGVPREEDALLELNLRWGIGGPAEADVTAMVAILSAILGDAAFVADFFTAQRLPHA